MSQDGNISEMINSLSQKLLKSYNKLFSDNAALSQVPLQFSQQITDMYNQLFQLNVSVSTSVSELVQKLSESVRTPLLLHLDSIQPPEQYTKTYGR